VRALQSDLEEATAAHHREADAHLHLQELCSELEKTLEQSESAARDQRLNAAQAVSLLKGEVARMQDEKVRADREHAVQIERLAQVAAQGEERLLAELQREKQGAANKLERSKVTAKEAAEAAGQRALEAMRKLQAEQQAKEERQRSEHRATLESMELRSSLLQETIAGHVKRLDEQQAAHASALQGLQAEASKSRLEATRWEKAAKALQSDLEEAMAAHHPASELCSELEKGFEQSESAALDQRLNAAQTVSLLQGLVALMQDEKVRADREHERLAQEVKLLMAELQVSASTPGLPYFFPTIWG
jgi:hypothetical protein